ncbi:MAG TPA: PAS domain S-box protein, partial [bacterium (Candidatus Stahlbacteria)]|nr:PAS domain S-box protein [Candidatus Stahlbacteria bacterium]
MDEEVVKKFLRQEIFLETIPYSIVAMDNECRIIYSNDAFSQFIGIKPKELVGKDITGYFPDLFPHFERALKTRLPQETYIEYGSSWHKVKIFPLTWGLLVVGHDISRWKELAELYNNLVERPQYGVIIAQGSEPRLIFVNEIVADFLGYSKEELLSMKTRELLKLIHEDDRPMVRERYRKRLAKEDVPSHYEMRVVKKSGEVRWVEVFSKLTTYSGNPSIQATFVDITESKRLRLDWEDIFNAIPHPALILDKNYRIVEANTAAAQLLDKKTDELKGGICYELYHGEDNPPEGCPFKKMLDSNSTQTADVIFGSLDKKFLITCTPISDQIIHIATPISERIETERELTRERAYLKSLFESFQEAVVLVDNDGRLIDANEEFTRIFGYDQEEVIGENVDDLIADPEHREEAKRLSEETFQGNKVHLETIRQRKDGRLIDVSIMAAPICVGDEQIGVYAVYRDITERKQMERKYRDLVEKSLQGIVVIQDGKVVFANQAAAEMSGYSREELYKLSEEE